MGVFLKTERLDRNVYELAHDRVRRAYDLYDHVAVSFSGGKDSTVCLHVTLDVAKELDRLPLDVFFWDEEAIHPQTIEYVERVREWPEVNLRWLCLPVKHRNACSRSSPWWYPWAPEDQDKWCRPLPEGAITELPGFNRHPIPESNRFVFPPSMGTVGIIMGIRAGESIRRWRSVARREADNFIAQDPLAKHCYLVKPIYDWSTQDVWTAPAKFGWDYNKTYDILQAAGTTRHAQRVCPPYGEEPLQGLWQYAICWPELWEKMIHRVPGAATAARYSCSPLYAYGDVPGWDPEADPKELIAGVLNRWPADMRREIKHRVNTEVRNHYRKTRDPIPSEAPGSTGVTWKFLYMLAVRGDIKERRNPKYQAEARKVE